MYAQPDALAFAREARVLLLRHQPTGIDVDVALGCLPFEEEAVARATPMQVAGPGRPGSHESGHGLISVESG